MDAGLRRTSNHNTRRKRLRKEWPPWPIFCTMMATAAPRPIPATSSGFAHATNVRRNRVVIENDDVMVLRLQDTAKGVVAAGRGGAGIANNVLLGVPDDCPASGHHARTQRGRQRVDPAYGTPAGCCTGARPGNTPQNNHNGSTTRARSAVCNANIGAGDDVRAVPPPSRDEGTRGTPVGAQRGDKTIDYGLAVPGSLETRSCL